MKDPLKQAIIDGNADVATALTAALLASGASAREILDDALLPGMEVVGQRMREGECFIPEVLAGITLAQLTERGSPVMYGSSTTAMDLKLAAASVGSPEIALISAAVAQLARRYTLPSFVAGL